MADIWAEFDKWFDGLTQEDLKPFPTHYPEVDVQALIARAEKAEARVRELEEELLRVSTAGHGAAHEIDNIAVEAGLGHSPRPGVVAAYVRELKAVVKKFEDGTKLLLDIRQTRTDLANGASDAEP